MSIVVTRFLKQSQTKLIHHPSAY